MKRTQWVGVLVAIVAVLVVFPAAGARDNRWWYTSWQWERPAAWGNLTWNGGQGGIAWVPDPPTDELSPADPTPDQVHKANGYARAYTEKNLGTPASVYTFTSAPLPQTLYLNGSRQAQLELQLTDPSNANPCNSASDYYYSISDPNIEVRLDADGKRLAGYVANDYILPEIEWWWWYGTAPGDPDGFCTYRMPMGLESGVLPQGTVLKLTLTFHEQERGYQIGFGPDHPSVLNLPLFTPDEILFRFPLPEVEDEEAIALGDAPDGGAGLSVAPLVLLGLAAAWPARRRHGTVGLAFALLATAALAGCVGGGNRPEAAPSEELRGRLQNQIVGGSGLAVGDLGSIVGVVYDENHVPVAGVHVSLLGLTNFTDTDGRGRFQFLNLLPGVYKLRFDRKEYQGFEAELQVAPGKVSKPQVTLYFSNPKDRDARPHNHDYWPAGKVSREIMNRRVPVVCPGTGGTACQLAESITIPPKVGEFNTVLPGTVDVEVVLDWTPSQARHERFGLAVAHNGDPGSYYPNRTMFAPRGPGEPFHIATAWEMADPGHQPASTWKFLVYGGDPRPMGGYTGSELDSVSTVPPEVTMRVTVHKGVLPLEPPHPDLWGTRASLEILKNQQGGWTTCLTPPTNGLFDCTGVYIARWEPTKLIPPGTATLDVTLATTASRTTPYSWMFYYKPANVLASEDYYAVEGAKAAGPPTVDGSKLKWTIRVAEEETDFMYSKATTWLFFAKVTDENGAWSDYVVSLSNLGLVLPYPTLHLTVTAKKA